MAFHLGFVNIDDLKDQITHSQFLEWLEFLRDEEHRRTKSDYYLAQIACTIARANSTEPRKVKLDDYLLSFRADDESTPEQSQAKPQSSKDTWLAIFGLGKKTKKKKTTK